MTTKNMSQQTPKFDFLLSWFVPTMLIALWQILSSIGWISERTLPAPLTVIEAAVRLIQSGELHHIGDSTVRALLGLGIGGGIGLLLGFLNGIFPIAEKLLDSTVQMLRNIPHLALIPLAIMWFGIGEESKLFLVALGVFFPIYLNTFHGIRHIDPGFIEVGQIYQLTPWYFFWNIILPNAIPSILIGLRYALWGSCG